MEITKLTADEVVARMQRGERFVFIDARSSATWNAVDAILPGAIHVPADEVGRHVSEIPLGHPLVSYCDSPHEQSSARVARELTRRGFFNAHPLVGGLDAWRKAGYPIEHKNKEPRNGSWSPATAKVRTRPEERGCVDALAKRDVT